MLKLITTDNGKTCCVPLISPRRAPTRTRWAKIRTAQTRIAAGYYDRESVRAQVVDAVLHELRKR